MRTPRRTRSWLSATLATLLTAGLLAGSPAQALVAVPGPVTFEGNDLYSLEALNVGDTVVVNGPSMTAYTGTGPGCSTNPTSVATTPRGDGKYTYTPTAGSGIWGLYVADHCVSIYERYDVPAVPTITGDPTVGQSLSAALNAYQPAGGAFKYEWMANGSSVGSSPTYTVDRADVGKSITVQVTIKNGSKMSRTTSAGVTGKAPATFSDFTPVITGSGKAGEKLTTSEPTDVTPTPESYAYSWRVNDQRSPVSETEEYTPRLADVGKKVILTVTAKGADGQPADTSVTVEKDIVKGPGFAGDLQVGKTLTSASPAGNLYWQLADNPDCNPSSTVKSTQTTYTLPAEAAGQYVVHQEGYSRGTCEGPIAKGSFGDLAASYDGDTTILETVTAVDPTDVPEGTTFSYAWTVGEATVSTERSYTIGRKDAGQDLTLAITAKADGYEDKTVSTDPAAIAYGTLAGPGLVVSDSTPETAPTTGDTLSLGAPEATISAADPEDATTTWAWGHRVQDDAARGGTCVADGTFGTDTHTVTNADAGQLICARILTQAEGYEDLYSSADADGTAVGTFTAPTVTFDQAPQVGVESKPVVTGLDPEGTPSYSWKVDGTEVSTNEGYEPTPDQVGRSITVTVTNTKDDFVDDVSSTESATIKKGVFTIRQARITGTPKVGQTLTHSLLRTPRKPANVTYTYQWGLQLGGEEDCLAIGATTRTLTLPKASAGARVCVIATATAPGYKNAVSVSDLTDVVDGLDLVVVTPKISDTTPEIGDTLTASVTREGFPQDATVEFLWGHKVTDEDDVTTCSPFRIEPSGSYQVRVADGGTALCVIARVSAEGYNTGQAVSRFTSKVAKRSFGPVTVSISDPTPTVGDTLTPTVSTSVLNYGFDVEWGVLQQSSGGSPSDGPFGSGGPAPAVCQTGGISSSNSFTVPASLVGQQLCVKVFLVADGYEDATATSDFTEPVAAGTLSLGTPVISDTTPTFGDVLTASVSGAPEGASTSWSWGTFNPLSESCDVAWMITMAEQPEGEVDPSSHTVTADEVGQRLCVVATVSADGYEQASATSDATDAVSAATFTGGEAAFTSTPKVGVSGTASVSGLDPEPTGATYVWTVDGTQVSTDASYTPAAADADKSISVTITSTKDGYEDSVLSTSATVQKGDFTTSGPTIDDLTAEVGQTLTGSVDLDDAPDGAVVSYWWGVTSDGSCRGLPDAFDQTFRVPASLLGKKPCLIVGVFAPGYNSTGGVMFGFDVVAGSFTAPDVTIDDTTPVVGQTLKADVDTSGLDLVSTPSVSYRWGTYPGGLVSRGSSCDLFESDPSATYTVKPGDVTTQLCAVATVSAEGYTSDSSEASTDAVGRGTTSLGAPTIAGSPKVGVALTATGPTLPSGGTATYYWGTAAVGSTKCSTSTTAAVSFTPKATDLGRTVCVVAKVTGMTAYEDATSAPAFSSRVRETAAVTLDDYTIVKGQKFTISATDLTPGRKYSIEVYDVVLTGTAGANGRISRTYTYPRSASSKTRKVTVVQVDAAKKTIYRKAVYLTYTK